MIREIPTNCFVCDREVKYLWEDLDKTTNLENASDIFIQSDYGSEFDLDQYSATVCDNCLQKAIELKKVRYIKTLKFKCK
jgi:hypothetical protein